MIAIKDAASLLSRVLILPKLADDLLTAASQQNAREALADGHFRRRFYAIAVERKEADHEALLSSFGPSSG